MLAAGQITGFFADSMLGSLARWLRTMGIDCLYDRAILDSDLVRRVLAEGRFLLTRDKLLAGRRILRGRVLLVKGDCVKDQLRHFVDEFGLPQGPFLTRCIRCNSPLRDAPRPSVKGLVPEYVYDTANAFKRCPECDKVYWPGTHRDKILKDLKTLLGKGEGG
jgi:uncharacterized protein with PIN domain